MTSHQLSASPSVTYVLNLLCYLCIEPVPAEGLNSEPRTPNRSIVCHSDADLFRTWLKPAVAVNENWSTRGDQDHLAAQYWYLHCRR